MRLCVQCASFMFCLFKQKTAYEMRISDWSSDVCSSDLPGDDPMPVFSTLGNVAQHPRQVSCWITHSNAHTHDLIRGALDRSPLYSGQIEGIGPRYCPSIEDKVVRFADKDSHQILDRKSTRLNSSH